MKVGLALAGGGVKGAAHIGVIRALEENNIQVEAIAGTSIGSIVAVLYAMGYTAEEMLKLFKYFAKNLLKADPKYFISNIKNLKRLLGYGMLSGESIEIAVEECAKLKDIQFIKDIKMPIAIPTVDVINCQKYVFTNQENLETNYITDIEIGKAVRASCSYPGIFAPCEYKEYKFVDGGILDNVPVDELKKLKTDKIITIKFPPNRSENPRNIYDVAFKSIDIMFEERDNILAQESDYILDIDVASSSVFNIKKIEDCYNVGYVTAISKIDEIKEAIKL